jgi:hypothetical protein
MSSELAIPDPIHEMSSPLCTKILSLLYNATLTRSQIEDAIEQNIAELVCRKILPIDVNREFILQYVTTREGQTAGFGYIYFKDESVALSFVGYCPDGSNLYNEITITNGNVFPDSGKFVTNIGEEIECYYEAIPGTRKNNFVYADKTEDLDLEKPLKSFSWADECEQTVISSSATMKFFVRINNKFGNIPLTEMQRNYLRENPSREQNTETFTENISCSLLINYKTPEDDQIRVLSVTCCENSSNINEIRLHSHFKQYSTSPDNRIFRYFSNDEKGEKKEIRTTWPVVFCHPSKTGRTIYFVRFDPRTRDEESALIMNYVTKIDNVVYSTRWASNRSKQALRVLEYQLNEAYEIRKSNPPPSYSESWTTVVSLPRNNKKSSK